MVWPLRQPVSISNIQSVSMAMPFDEAGGKNWESYQRWSSGEAEATLQAPFCTDLPSSNQLVLFLHSLLSELDGTGAGFEKEGCREAGRQRDLGRPWERNPFCPPSSADTSRGCRAAPAWVSW